MARIRLSGGIVPAEDQAVWLVDAPGHEVDGARPAAGAPVVVGPDDASRAQVERARREAGRLVTGGGPLVAAARVDLGQGFTTARLEGGGEARRDAVLAAVELLGIDGIGRVGSRQAVLVALFGARATKRVGAAALAVVAGGARSALRLAVAASDVLEPEQLEQVLQLVPPAGVEPVPQGTTSLLADQLAMLLGPFSSKRRLTLVRSVWDEVVGWQLSDAARARARRRRVSATRAATLLAQVRRRDDAWWRQLAFYDIGDQPSAARMMSWVPPERTRQLALRRAFQECASATLLVRVALAAEERPIEEAVLASLEPLAYAATAHVALSSDRVTALHQCQARGEPAADRAWALASGVVLASEPGDLVEHDMRAYLRAQLRSVRELAQAVLGSTVDLVNGGPRAAVNLDEEPTMTQWRRLVGYTPQRDPREWWAGDDPAGTLAGRLEGHDGDPAEVERIEDLLWLAELADALAAWFGHHRAVVDVDYIVDVNVDPPAAPPDPRRPSLESVSLAVAGAAQLVALGAAPPARPASWPALVDGLVEGTERLGLDGRLTVPADVAGFDGQLLPGTDLCIEVGRSGQQLAEWGNYMGNCIATYAEDASRRFALVALRNGAGKLVANVSLQRSGERWAIAEAYGRFNGPLPDDLLARLREWAHVVREPSATGATRPPAPPAPPRPGHGPRRRRAPARERLLRAAARLGDTIGEVAEDPIVLSAREAFLPIARELGWAGDAGDSVAPFVAVARPRRCGPLAAAAARSLDDGLSLAGLWQATCVRPLATYGALEAMDGTQPDLSRLAETTVPASLRLALREPRVWQARVVDLAGRRVRLALSELLAAGDPRLDRATVLHPHTGFLTAAVLACTVWEQRGDGALEALSVSAAGGVPGRPASSVMDEDGPWAAARAAAAELGVATDQVDQVLAGAPGRHLLVPAAWTTPAGWARLWGRAHRETAKVAVPRA